VPSPHRAKSERGIRELPSGSWEYSIRFKGKLERKVFPTKGVCKAQREKRLVELREGYYGIRKAPTIEEAVKKFLSWSKTSCKKATAANDAWVADLWLSSPTLKGSRLDRITPEDVQRFKEEMRSRKRPAPAGAGEGASPLPVGTRSADVALARLRRLFSLGKDWWALKENPAARVPLFHEDSSMVRYLTDEEEEALLEKCGPRLAQLVRFAVLTGMRKSEILSLCPREVDLKAGVARLPGTRTKAKVWRTVPLNAEAVEILKELGQHRDFIPPDPPEKPRPLPEIPHIANRFGKKDWRLYISFLKAVKEAGLHDFTFHDLRHTFASRLVMAGVNLVTVQHLLGHSTVLLTQRYAHLAPGAESEAVKLLSKGESIRNSTTAPKGRLRKSP
jgi:integrase